MSSHGTDHMVQISVPASGPVDLDWAAAAAETQLAEYFGPFIRVAAEHNGLTLSCVAVTGAPDRLDRLKRELGAVALGCLAEAGMTYTAELDRCARVATAAVGSRRYLLDRPEDHTGVSGTGVVAEVCEFSDGEVALHWVVPGKPRFTTRAADIAGVEEINCHDSTRLIPVDR